MSITHSGQVIDLIDNSRLFLLEDRLVSITPNLVFLSPGVITTYDFEGTEIASVTGASTTSSEFNFWHILDEGDGAFSGYFSLLGLNGGFPPQGRTGNITRFDADLTSTPDAYEYPTSLFDPRVPDYFLVDWTTPNVATSLSEGRVAVMARDEFAVYEADGSLGVRADIPAPLSEFDSSGRIGGPDVVALDVLVTSGSQVMLVRRDTVQREDALETTDDGQIYATVINADGSVAVSQFEITETDHFQLQGGTNQIGTLQRPSVAVLENGNVAIAWSSRTEATSQTGVFLKIVAMDGATVLSETLVSDEATSTRDSTASVHALDGGGFVMVWARDGNPAAQRFTADGTPVGETDMPFALNTQGVGQVLVAPDGTGFISGAGDEAALFSVDLAGTDGRGPPGVALTGDNGDNDLTGSAGADTIEGDRGDDTILGGAGDDDIRAGVGEDSVDGGVGADFIRGGIGEDTLLGGDGDDQIRGQKNADTLEGGDGDDNLKGGGGNDNLSGGDGNDFLKGGTRRDVIDGGAGRDKLFGNSFDDLLIGGSGNDLLNAGGDDDTLEGGTGNDRLKGGTGADIFVFEADMGADLILDFETGIDTLEISAALVGGAATGAQVESLFGVPGEAILDFGDGNTITFRGLASTDGLGDDILIV